MSDQLQNVQQFRRTNVIMAISHRQPR